MKIGKLDVELVEHEVLGEIFRIKAKGTTKESCFEVKNNTLYLRVSKQTALLLADHIDRELNRETGWEDSDE